ncbi:polysaccharide/polyol phosphate ABC transporter ATP-binding protein, partial [Yersinia frederiksenii]
MKKNEIILNNVNLHYSSVAYKERSLKSLLTNLFKKKKSHTEIKDIHALKNINLQVKSGERIGLLGHNGAGKV